MFDTVENILRLKNVEDQLIMTETGRKLPKQYPLNYETHQQ